MTGTRRAIVVRFMVEDDDVIGDADLIAATLARLSEIYAGPFNYVIPRDVRAVAMASDDDLWTAAAIFAETTADDSDADPAYLAYAMAAGPAAAALSGVEYAWPECECGDDGPCESHAELVWSSNNHLSADDQESSYLITAHDLGVDVPSDALAIARDQWSRTGPMEAWRDDPAESDLLREAGDAADDALFRRGFYVLRDGDVTIYRLTGGPLA